LEQVWHQIKITAAGLELMASLEADKTGASAVPGKQQCCSWMWRFIDVPCVLPDSEKQATGWCVCGGEARAPLLVVLLCH